VLFFTLLTIVITIADFDLVAAENQPDPSKEVNILVGIVMLLEGVAWSGLTRQA
jgi:hypothetical protein